MPPAKRFQRQSGIPQGSAHVQVVTRLGAAAQQRGACRTPALAVDVDAGFHAPQCVGIDQPLDLDVIGLLDALFGIGDGCGERGVVAEQQQALAGAIEPPHGSDPRQVGTGEAVVDRRPPLLVRTRGHEPPRLVQQQVQGLGGGRFIAIDGDIRVEQGRGLRIAHDPPAHAHAPGRDKSRRLAPRTQPALRQHAGKAVTSAHSKLSTNSADTTLVRTHS